MIIDRFQAIDSCFGFTLGTNAKRVPTDVAVDLGPIISSKIG
jgi:hypothetical protein